MNQHALGDDSLGAWAPRRGSKPGVAGWIKQLLDQVLGSAGWVVVVVVGLALVAFPLGIVLFYITQLRRDRSDRYQATEDGP